MGKKYKYEINWDNDFAKLICGFVDLIYDIGSFLIQEKKVKKKK